MKKQITITILGIMMIATALAMYGGETMTFETNMTNPVYTVVGNSSNLDGLNITFENGIISISLAQNYKPDNYTILFLDNITYEVEVEKIIYRSGGTRTKVKYVDRNNTVYVPHNVQVEKIVEVETIKLNDKECEDILCLDTPELINDSDFNKWLIGISVLIILGIIAYTVYRSATKE